MKFGVNTFIWTASFDRSHFALLPGIKNAGFDGVELPLINLDEVDAPAIRKVLAENELECTFCSVIPSGMSVISDDAGVRAKTRAHLESCIQVAAEAGAKLIAGPIYRPWDTCQDGGVIPTSGTARWNAINRWVTRSQRTT